MIIAEDSKSQKSNWERFKRIATDIARKENFPLSVLLGQAAIETGRGTSPMSRDKNNWFGLEAYDWNPNLAISFKSMEDSIKYYINLIKNNPRYVKAWVARDDPIRMIKEIKRAGYATDPNYVDKIINTSEFADNMVDRVATDIGRLIKITRKDYGIIIPITLIHKLGWRVRQWLEIDLEDQKLIIKNWKKNSKL